MNRTVVNIKELQKESIKVKVRKVTTGIYMAFSRSKDSYEHTVKMYAKDGRYHVKCNCQWAAYFGEGCRHSLAVIRFAAAEHGRRVSFWNNYEKAKKQKGRVIQVGNNLWVTSRNIEHKKRPTNTQRLIKAIFGVEG